MISLPEREYRRKKPNGHWFDKDAIRFFGTRIGSHLWASNGDLLFISSEHPPHSPRLYAVRRMNKKTGNITGAIGQYTTRSRALSAMKHQAKPPESEASR